MSGLTRGVVPSFEQEDKDVGTAAFDAEMQQRSQEVQENVREQGFDPMRGTHGTTFVPGMTSVDPSNKSKDARPVHSGLSDPDRAYYTADLVEPVPDENGWLPRDMSNGGWTWANMASGSKGDSVPKGTNDFDVVPGRPVVHHVEPQGRIDPDRNLNPMGKVAGELTADSLKITDTEWIKPMDIDQRRRGGQGMQGTLPNENWNKYGGKVHEDLNNLPLGGNVWDTVWDKPDHPRVQLRGQQQFDF